MSSPAPNPAVSRGAQRRAARLAAVQVLYALELIGAEMTAAQRRTVEEAAIADAEADGRPTPETQLMTAVIRGVREAGDALDAALAPCLSGRPLGRLEILLRCILRAGAWELTARPDIDTALSIGEYVAVTDAFFGGGEPELVNAVLDKLARDRADPPDGEAIDAVAPSGDG